MFTDKNIQLGQCAIGSDDHRVLPEPTSTVTQGDGFVTFTVTSNLPAYPPPHDPRGARLFWAVVALAVAVLGTSLGFLVYTLARAVTGTL